MRYRFVDRIVELDSGKNILCEFTWPETLEIFQDHFPSQPIVPGVLLTEMMGQSAALCLEEAEPGFGGGVLLQIKNAVFRNWVKPGELLHVHAEVLTLQSKLAKVKTRSECQGKLMASAELVFSFESKEHLGLPEVDPVLEAYCAQNGGE